MTSGIWAHGTLLKIGDGGDPESFTTITEVTDIGGPSLEMNTIEMTSHDSVDGWAEFVGGILDAGEVTFSINYIPTDSTHDAGTGLIKDMADRTVRNFQLVFPDGSSTTWSFSALVTNFEPGEPVDDKLSADVTLKISGKPTLA
jgi:predicted secreted protein